MLAGVGVNATLNATVYNLGLDDETNVRLQMIINDTIVSNVTIDTLHAGENYAIHYAWTAPILHTTMSLPLLLL